MIVGYKEILANLHCEILEINHYNVGGLAYFLSVCRFKGRISTVAIFLCSCLDMYKVGLSSRSVSTM